MTGATGGIGLETARGIAQRGAAVMIVGRSLEKSRTAVVGDRHRDDWPDGRLTFARRPPATTAPVSAALFEEEKTCCMPRCSCVLAS